MYILFIATDVIKETKKLKIKQTKILIVKIALRSKIINKLMSIQAQKCQVKYVIKK